MVKDKMDVLNRTIFAFFRDDMNYMVAYLR